MASAYFPFGCMEMEGVCQSEATSYASSGLSSDRRGRNALLRKKAPIGATSQTPSAPFADGIPGLDVATVAKLWGVLSGRFKNLRALALVLHLRLGHVCSLRIRHSRPIGSLTHPKLHHSFIVATNNRPSAPSDTAAIAIDPYFRQQFAIGLYDPEYSSFLNNEVPEVFVGSLSLMHSMLEVICAMMQEALCRLGVGTPPWRQPAAVMSKWFPERMQDEVVGPQLAGVVAAAPGAAEQQDKGIAAKGSAASLKRLVDRNAKVQPGRWQPDEPNGPKVVVVGFNLALEGRQQPEQRSDPALGNTASINRASSPSPGSDCAAAAAAVVKSLSEPCHGWMRLLSPHVTC